MKRIALLGMLCAIAGCHRPRAEAVYFADSTGGRSTDGATRNVGMITGLENPESVRYDADQDAYFISNMLGYGSVKDNAGYIVRVSASNIRDSRVFVQSGRGATLNAPKGMAIVGDTLWVADIDVVRGFERHTGRSVGTIDFSAFHPTLLNDVGAGPDGVIRVTDTGVILSPVGVLDSTGDRVFEVDSHRHIRVVGSAPQIQRPNGITWDPNARRWMLVDFGKWSSALSTLADNGTRQTLQNGPGKFDGVEVLPDGRVAYTCWNDSSVHVWSNGHDERLLRALPMPADIGVDTRRNRIAVPLSGAGRVELWQLAPASVASR